MGRLNISRGHQLQGRQVGPSPQLALVSPSEEPLPAPSPAPLTPDYSAVHDRLTALERLTRLFELGTLSAAEFAREKALILALPADELLLRDPAPVSFVPATRRPSLVGRMLNWKFALFGLVAGLALSAATEPRQMSQLVGQALHLIGA